MVLVKITRPTKIPQRQQTRSCSLYEHVDLWAICKRLQETL